MTISINTNIASLTAQKSLNQSTAKMNTAMERLSTGYKINSSKDDAAGMAVSSKLNYKISSLDVAHDNGQMGASMLDTSEGVYNLIKSNFQRIRDLTEQAANGTYGSDSMAAIKTEVCARLNEISRVANSTEFNGQYLMNGSVKENINLQVGIHSDDYSFIELDKKLFAPATATALIKIPTGDTVEDLCDDVYVNDTTARKFLDKLDTAIKEVTTRTTTIGGIQQRIIAAMDSADVMKTSMTNAVALIQDADIAEESSNYVKQQILQQTSASMLATANQAPSIALQLLG